MFPAHDTSLVLPESQMCDGSLALCLWPKFWEVELDRQSIGSTTCQTISHGSGGIGVTFNTPITSNHVE